MLFWIFLSTSSPPLIYCQRNFSYVSNWPCFSNNSITVLCQLLIDQTKLSTLFCLFHIFNHSIIKKSKGKTCFQGHYWHYLIFLFDFKRFIFYFYFWSNHCLLFICLFALIGSAFIGHETCPRVWEKIFCWPYPNYTYRFSSPTVFRKFMTRVKVGCQYLFTSIVCLFI